MTPAARYHAAIEILDAVNAGAAVEQVLTSWARRSRFAGSSDRAAIRDIVFDVTRRRRSCAARGGGETGRALVLGLCRAESLDPDSVFTGLGHAPPPLDAAERAAGREPRPGSPEALDCPGWLLPLLRESLGSGCAAVLEALRHRAPVFARVNLARATRGDVVTALEAEGIAAKPDALSPSALEITAGERRLRNSAAFADGLVELQDAASQAVADMVPLREGETLLDYCGGGGGKTLAVAARVRGRFLLHDVRPERMRDVPARAQRAGTAIEILRGDDLRRCDPVPVVLVDAPCSGSGAWRRSPEGKWRLGHEDLSALLATQDTVLDAAAALTDPVGGRLVYATCSLLAAENAERVAAFLDRHPGWRCETSRTLTPLDGADGFFAAILCPAGA